MLNRLRSLAGWPTIWGGQCGLDGEVAQNRKDLPDRYGDEANSPVVAIVRPNVIYAGLLLGVSAAWPLTVAWRNARGSTIRHALAWAWIAWAAWLWYGWSGAPSAAYAALTLMAATGIAVFGARRPGAMAWHFIVIGLLVVLWMPWIESIARHSEPKAGGFRDGFLVVLIIMTTLNYAATKFYASALAMLGASLCAAIGYQVSNEAIRPGQYLLPLMQAFAMLLLALALWLAWTKIGRNQRGSATDQLWSHFRDTFGAVWALRLREQFNMGAQNAGWLVRLGWFGLVPKTDTPAPEWHSMLAVLQKRFGEPST